MLKFPRKAFQQIRHRLRTLNRTLSRFLLLSLSPNLYPFLTLCPLPNRTRNPLRTLFRTLRKFLWKTVRKFLRRISKVRPRTWIFLLTFLALVIWTLRRMT